MGRLKEKSGRPQEAGPARRAGPRLSLRWAKENRLHHLWLNNGVWWAHFTVHTEQYTKHRVRISLRTGKLTTAIRRRNQILRRHGLL